MTKIEVIPPEPTSDRLINKTYEMLRSIHAGDTVVKTKQPKNPLGLVGKIIAVGGLVGVLQMGPLDFARTMYNQLIGDTPSLKRQLVNYVDETVRKREYIPIGGSSMDVTAKILHVELGTDHKINPQDVPITTLWDASEDYNHSYTDYWIGPRFK